MRAKISTYFSLCACNIKDTKDDVKPCLRTLRCILAAARSGAADSCVVTNNKLQINTVTTDRYREIQTETRLGG